MNRPEKRNNAGARAVVVLGLLAALGAAPAFVLMRGAKVYAAKDARPERVAEGKVETKAGAPINGAVVYLKNAETLTVESFICGTDGTFRFGQLSPSTDYSIWAQANGKRSKTRSVSSFDDKNDFYFTFTIGG